MLIVFAIIAVTALVFRQEAEVHHHFYGSRGEGQAHHKFVSKVAAAPPQRPYIPKNSPIQNKAPPLDRAFPESFPMTDPNISYDHLAFAELPFEPRNAALKLGYTARSWNYGDEDPEVFSKPWQMLSIQERNAAKTLGYTRSTWGEDESGSGDDDGYGSGDEEGSDEESVEEGSGSGDEEVSGEESGEERSD